MYIIQRRNENEWSNQVEVISSDMRDWRPGPILDIVISELLGSFGDNELSPECLLGAAHLLKVLFRSKYPFSHKLEFKVYFSLSRRKRKIVGE